MASFVPPGPDPWEVKQALVMCSAAYQYTEDLDSYFRGVAHDIKFCSLSVADPYGGQIAIGLANKGDDQYTFIALSGTNNLQHMLTNFAEAAASASEVGAHKAFLERATSIPLDYLFDVAAKGKLLITGHSLGGACAALLTAAFVQKYVDRNFVKSVRCITFGSPLVGQSPSFCAYMSPFRGLFTHYVSEKDSIAISLSSRRVLSDYGFVNDNQSDEPSDLVPFGTYVKLGFVQSTSQAVAHPLSVEETTEHFTHHSRLSVAAFEVKLAAHQLKAYKLALFRADVIEGENGGAPVAAPGEMDSVRLRPEYCILRGNILEVYGSGMWLLSSIAFTQNGDRSSAVRRTEGAAYFILKDVETLPVQLIGTTNHIILQFFSFFNRVTTSATLPLNKVDFEEGLMPDALISRMMPLCTLAVFDSASEHCEAQKQFLELRSHCDNIITNLPMEFVFCVISRSCVGPQQQQYGTFVKMLLQRLEEVDIDPGSLVSVSMINVLGEVIARLHALSTAEKKSLNSVGIFSSEASLLLRRTESSVIPPLGFRMFRQVSIPGRNMFYASGPPDERTNYWRMVYEYRIGVSVVLVSDAARLVGEIAQESFMFYFGAEGEEEVYLQLKKSVSIGGLIYRVYEVSCDLGDIQYKFNFYMFGVEALNEKTFNAITVLLTSAPFAECLATTGWLHVMSESTEEIAAFACSNVATAQKKSHESVKIKNLEVLRTQLGELATSTPHDAKWAAFVDNYNLRRDLITLNVRTMYYVWLAKEESAESRLISYISGLKREMHRTRNRVGASYFCGQSISMIVRNRATGVNEPFFNFMPTTRRETTGFTKAELIKSANEISDASQFLSLLLEGAVQRASVHLDEPDSMIRVVAKSLVFPVSALVDSMYGMGNLGLYVWNSFDRQYLMTARNNFVDSWHAIAYSQRLLASYEEILKAICDKANLVVTEQQAGSHAIMMENSVARSVEHTREIVDSSLSELCRAPAGFLKRTRCYSYVNERRNVPVLMFFLKLAFSSWKIRNTRKKFTVVTIGGKNNGGKTTLIDELFPGKLAQEDKPGGTADRTTIFPRAFSMVADPYTLYIDLPGITDTNTFHVARMMALCGNVTVFVLESLMSKSDNNMININSIKDFLTNKKGPGLICINQFDRNLVAEDPVGHDSDDDEPAYYSDSESESDCGSKGLAVSSVTPMLRTGDGVEESKSGHPGAPAAAAMAAKEFWDPPSGGSVDPLEAEYERRLMRVVVEEADAWRQSEFLKPKTWLTEAEPLVCERGHKKRMGMESGHEAVHAKGCGCGCAEAVVFSGTDANGWRTSIWLTCFDREARTKNRNSTFVDKNVFSPADVQAWVLEAKSKPNAYGFGGHY